MYPTNIQAFQAPEAITIPLQGGLDLVSPKAAGTPSTLQECYNFETADYPGYKQARGISVYSGLLKKVPTQVYRALDTGAAISGSHTLKAAGRYKVQNPSINILNMGVQEIQVISTVISGGADDGYVYFQILKGKFDDSGDSGSNITLLRPTGSTTLVAPQEVDLASFTSDLHDVVGPAFGNVLESRIPGSGRLNGMFVQGDRIYAARETPREWIVEFNNGDTRLESSLQEDQPIIALWDQFIIGGGPSVEASDAILIGRAMAYYVSDGTFAGEDAEGFIKILEYSRADNVTPTDRPLGIYPVSSWEGTPYLNTGGGPRANVVDDGTDNNHRIFEHNIAGSSLFTTNDQTNLTDDAVWKEVDLGLEIDFFEGGVKPNTALTLDLTEDIQDSNRRTLVGAPSASDGGTGFGNPIVPGFSNAWANHANALTDDANATTVAVRAAGNGTWHGSEKLKLTAPNLIVGRNTAITGVSVDVRHKKITAGVENEARLNHARLLGVGTSSIKRDLTLLGTSATTVTIGGEDDGWGNADFNREAVASNDFGIELAYQVRKTTAGSGSISVGVEYVEITVHFSDGTERVFFWDGSDDIAEAKLVSYFRREGLWSDTTAEGIMTLYDLNVYEETGDTPPPTSAVPPEQGDASLSTENSLKARNTTDTTTSFVPTTTASVIEIRNAPNGSGAILAKTDGDVREVYLPSGQAMIDEDSKMQTMVANFFFNKNGEATYGVTGAGPAFLYNGRYFVNIRLPVPAELDKPRHLAEHAKHLVLASKSGELFVSVIGEPTNFGGLDGASSWGFGDTITGLSGLYGNGLGVFCKGSIHALIGNSILSFTTQIISKSTGALEYTVTNMGQPIYCDERGIATITASQNYGDFDWGRISRLVSPWLQRRLKASYGVEPSDIDIRGVLPIRSAGQYKMFFNDGYILTLTLNADGAGTPEFTIQNYRNCACDAIDTTLGNPLVPTALVSDITDGGEEVVAWGDSNGDIFILQDDITGIWTKDNIINYQCYITLNPIDANLPHLNLRYNEVIAHGMVGGKKELTFSSGTNYLLPEEATAEVTRTLGQSNSTVSTTLIPAKVHAHLPNMTDGLSVKIAAVGNGDPCHYLQAMTYRIGSGYEKNNAPRNR